MNIIFIKTRYADIIDKYIKQNILKGGKKFNQTPYILKRFRLFDKVEFENKGCFIFIRIKTGYFDLRTLDGGSVHKSASYKKLKLSETRKELLTERGECVFSRN